jgi:hypothetical protein
MLIFIIVITEVLRSGCEQREERWEGERQTLVVRGREKEMVVVAVACRQAGQDRLNTHRLA